METKRIIEHFLQALKKTTITLEELEALFSGVRIDWNEFSTVLLCLEEDKTLEAVKSAGRTTRSPKLAYRYRVNKHLISSASRNLLNMDQLAYHSSVKLDYYHSVSVQEYEQDKQWIARIDQYIKHNGFPEEAAPAPERSFQLVSNEKWITDFGGETLLKRIGLWEQMRIYPVSDPLMLAVNPGLFDDPIRNECTHLIVENKTTFQALLPVLRDTAFHTLIYGCGNKITGNIDMFPLQYPVNHCEHQFFYFGDLDYEGIRIWYETNKQRPIRPATIFYEALLEMPFVIGKDNQRRNDASVQAFLTHFTQTQCEKIERCLTFGGYYPQETLTTSQLQLLWRREQWKQWIEMN
ncbi:hypothetical protein PaecuDRAFT_3940 [Paenibacillus curdlanolyticus YK9]|uniref:Wadjet protein JetD C-terminal domain-containing protein n=1 Tax=Paenibacillus curdlanolyticus YK9 TaxID=717606 RepID=E0IE49_9BACL|nr:Wadjet anti-phage system protein JetD domain-containing protein [Paenibacillus curdlanolyticus]EFM09403.1 hypothetical protein PaecuDRAFT_3940 [Paenibacillus curdlanolyticus YK9]